MNMLKRMATLLLMSLVAGCGGGGSDAGTSPFGPGAGTPLFNPGAGTTVPTLVTVSASAAQLGSGGDPVTISAVVKDAGAALLPAVPVTFSTGTGTQLTSVDTVTNAVGVANAVLSVSTDKSDRNVTVTVTAGTVNGTLVLPVTGTTLVYTGATSVALGSTANVVVQLTDSKGVAIAGLAIAVANTNSLNNHLSASTATTDALGNASVTFTPGVLGTDTLFFTGAGTTATASIAIN